MNDSTPSSTTSPQAPVSAKSVDSESERIRLATVAGWTCGTVGFFGVGALFMNSSWPMAFGLVPIAAMVSAVCYFILKPPR